MGLNVGSQQSSYIHVDVEAVCMGIINRDLQFGKSCPNERLSSETKSPKRDFVRGRDALECSEGESLLSSLLSACCFAGYIINRGGCLVFESRHSCYYN